MTATEPSQELLRTSLQAAVPLHIIDVRDWTFEQRRAAAEESAYVIAEHGDDLLYGGKHCADAFNRLALGIACAAYQPGGIRFLGDHWEATSLRESTKVPIEHDYEREFEMLHDADDDDAYEREVER